jgi:hypothetical protein
VADYDGRAGIEAELKSEKRGIALAVLRKRRRVSQTAVVLLVGLAQNVLGLCARLARQSCTALAGLWHRAPGRSRSGPCLGGSSWLESRCNGCGYDEPIRLHVRWLWAGGHSWREDHLDWL